MPLVRLACLCSHVLVVVARLGAKGKPEVSNEWFHGKLRTNSMKLLDLAVNTWFRVDFPCNLRLILATCNHPVQTRLRPGEYREVALSFIESLAARCQWWTLSIGLVPPESLELGRLASSGDIFAGHVFGA